MPACQELCASTKTGDPKYCYGFDFDGNQNECWIHETTPNYKINVGATPGVTHYNRSFSCNETDVLTTTGKYLVMESQTTCDGWKVLARDWPCYSTSLFTGRGGRIGKTWVLVMAITFSCAAIHFPAVYNLQHHQRSVPLKPFLYGVGG